MKDRIAMGSHHMNYKTAEMLFDDDSNDSFDEIPDKDDYLP